MDERVIKGDLPETTTWKTYGFSGYKSLVSGRTYATALVCPSSSTTNNHNMILLQLLNLAESTLHSLQSQSLHWTAGLVGLYILQTVSSP